jgi:hypothetical protein
MYSHPMLENTLATLALYIASLSTTIVPCMLSEDGEGCSKDRLIAALQWGFSLGLFLHYLLILDHQL